MLPIKKIYIDSRFKSQDSKSDSDFYVDLPQNMLMPEGCGFYLDDISIPSPGMRSSKTAMTTYTIE